MLFRSKSLIQFGIAKRVTDVLESSGLSYVIFDGVQPNPTIDNINLGLSLYKENGCDFLVSIGGGSAHDCTKAIGILATNGGEVKDYRGANVSKHKSPSIVAINTTAGTAAEITMACVITDSASKRKFAFRDKNALATLSVDDPELMTSLPKGLTAGTGMDALTHAVESYVSRLAYTLTDELALSAIKIVFTSLRTAVNDGANMDGRDAMVYAQLMAGMSFGNASCGIVHAMSHQLSGQYDLPHGLCNAILLPFCMEYNRKDPAVAAKYANMARMVAPDRAAGLDDAAASALAVKLVEELSADIGTNKPLSELGVKEEDFVLMATNSLEEGSMRNNPLHPSVEEVCEIYRAAL